MDKPSPINLLRIVLPEDATADQVPWYAFDAKHVCVGSGHNVLDALPPHQQLQLILPAGVVAGHLITTLKTAGRHLAAIIDQALEDTLLVKREETHVVIARQEAEGRLVWVCSAHWLNRWLARLHGAQLKPDSAFAIYDLLLAAIQPVTATTPTGCIFRTPNGQVGYLEDASLVGELLGTTVALSEDLFSQPLQDEAANFLTGLFAPRYANRLTPGQFRRSGALGLALACALLLGAIIHWQQLAAREKSLKDEIRQTFAAAFPGTPIVDPIMQWQSKQREASTGGAASDALDTLSQFANTLGAGILPRSAEYREGVIRLVISESDVAKLRPKLEAGKREFNLSPAEPGFSRLEIRTGSKP
ncbi:MAG: hypothetical protein H6R07_3025 [Proteobacteria bacterium]|nr:hypothetical protein [Pseudomonadota bacterium]